MRFSSIFSAVAAVSFGMYALASPMPLEVSKRQDTSDISTIIATAETAIAPALAGITALGPGATEDELSPFFSTITTALDTATSSLAALPPTSKSKRQSDTEIAQAIDTLITGIATALEDLVGSPEIATLLPGLDLALSNLLKAVEVLLADVLSLVATLLVDVAGLLNQLALGLTLASLGL